MAIDLVNAKIAVPDLEERRSLHVGLREIESIRVSRFTDTNGDERQVVTASSPFQLRILAAFGVDTSTRRSHVA